MIFYAMERSTDSRNDIFSHTFKSSVRLSTYPVARSGSRPRNSTNREVGKLHWTLPMLNISVAQGSAVDVQRLFEAMRFRALFPANASLSLANLCFRFI